MGNNRPNYKDNPPASTSPLKQNDEFAFTVSPNGAADGSMNFHDRNSTGSNLLSFPNLPMPVALPLENMHSTYQPCTQEISETNGNLMDDLMRLNSMQNPKIDPRCINIRSNTSGIRSPSEVSNVRGIPQYINQDYMVTADNLMNDGARFNNFQNPQANRNFMLKKNPAGGYQMMRQRGEANTGNMPQINRNFVRLGGSTPMLFRGQNTGQTQSDNNVEVRADRHGCQGKIDGSFLSLGIGGNTEARSNYNFSCLEIASKLEEAISPELNISNVRQTARSSPSMDQNLAADFPGFQINDGGFSSTLHNGGGWTLTNNDVGDICGANSGPGSHGNNSAGFLSSRQIGLSPESARPARITTNTNSDRLQNCYVKTAKNLSSESSMSCPSLGLRGSSNRRYHAGPLFPTSEGSATQAAESGQFRRLIDAQPAEHIAAQAAGGSLFSQRIGVQVAESSAAQFAPGGLFPKRLGVEGIGNGGAQAAEREMFLNRMGMQTASKLSRPSNRGSVHFPKSLLGPPFAIGRPTEGVPIQSSVNLHGPSSTNGQHQNVPDQFSKDLWRPASTNGQVIPVASVHGLSQNSDVYGRPSLKRNPIRPPPAARLVQRLKMTRPTFHHSIPQTIPSIPVPAPAAAHIKWQGSDGTPQPTGHKCLLCKRDLSFTPEGMVYQPTPPPAVAVLPCGHTFHDQCLLNITPEDQSKNPPCIPCAIGEN